MGRPLVVLWKTSDLVNFKPKDTLIGPTYPHPPLQTVELVRKNYGSGCRGIGCWRKDQYLNPYCWTLGMATPFWGRVRMAQSSSKKIYRPDLLFLSDSRNVIGGRQNIRVLWEITRDQGVKSMLRPNPPYHHDEHHLDEFKCTNYWDEDKSMEFHGQEETKSNRILIVLFSDSTKTSTGTHQPIQSPL